MKKGNKCDKSLVKFYRVISLLNCIKKLVEKVVAEKLSQFCETYPKLHKGQIRARINRCAVDVVVIMVNSILII